MHQNLRDACIPAGLKWLKHYESDDNRLKKNPRIFGCKQSSASSKVNLPQQNLFEKRDLLIKTFYVALSLQDIGLQASVISVAELKCLHKNVELKNFSELNLSS